MLQSTPLQSVPGQATWPNSVPILNSILTGTSTMPPFHAVSNVSFDSVALITELSVSNELLVPTHILFNVCSWSDSKETADTLKYQLFAAKE